MKLLVRYISMVTIGALCYSLALTILAIPNDLTEGGVPGAAVLLYYAFGWSPGIVTFILTSVILLIGYKSLSKRAIGLSLLAVPLVSLFIYLTEDKLGYLGDPLVFSIFAVFFFVICVWIIFSICIFLGRVCSIALM